MRLSVSLLIVLIVLQITACNSPVKDTSNVNRVSNASVTLNSIDNTEVKNDKMDTGVFKESTTDEYVTESDGETEYSPLIVPTRKEAETSTVESSVETYSEETSQVAGYSLNQTIGYETTYQETESIKQSVNETIVYSNYDAKVRYRTDVNLYDIAGIDKDSFGNYIIPDEMYKDKNKLPLNERGKMSYIFCYDDLRNVLNPFPDRLKSYKDLYELGSYIDPSSGKSVFIPIVDVK